MIDAARYRWFRENSKQFVDNFLVCVDEDKGEYVGDSRPEFIDICIDRELELENYASGLGLNRE
jgi:hypothetical protein